MLGLLTLLGVAAAIIAVLGTGVLIWRLGHPPRKTMGVALARGLPADPEAIGFKAEALSLELADGTATPGWWVEGGNPAGPVLIFVHGWADSRYGSLAWLPLVAPRASACVLWCLRAHGDSPAGRFTGGPREEADVRGIVREVAERAGPRPVVLIGWSMGAGIAIGAAAAGDLPVAGVVGDGVYRRPLDAPAGLLRAHGWPSEPFCTLARLVFALTGGPRYDRARDAARLDCPLLLLHAENDALCSMEGARVIAEAAEAGERVVFEGCGHLQAACEHPERYAEALDRFLAPRPGT